MGVLISHSAYAASYVNVSSGGSGDTAGVVSLGKIKPSSSGSIATGNDTLTVHTDCSAGYKVYVSGQNGKTTNLTNQSAEDPTNPSTSDIISASSNTIASPNTLSSNTWGISGSSTDIENHLYAGLPAYADATSTALVTKTNVEEESTVPIYYGVNANTAINPGTYKGDILYTVLMDSSCIPYTVEFDPNVEDETEITGEMESQSILPNSPTALATNAYNRSGYVFLGWSTTPEGKTGNVTNGIGTEDDVDYEDEEEVENLAVGGSSITLYAIWGDLGGDMQGWTGCSKMSVGDIVDLKDTRDNKVYAVKKLPDGKCWMIENLTISATGMVADSLDNTNTNIPSSDTNKYYLPPQGKAYQTVDSITNSAVKSATASVDFGTSSSNYQTYSRYPQVGYRAKNTTDNNTGNPVPENTAYYNFYTASLGYSYYNDDKTSGSTPRDICPKGWRLPFVSDNGNSSITAASSEFANLARSYNGSASWSGNGATNYSYYTSDSTIRENMVAGDSGSLDRFASNGAAGFTYAGNYNGATLDSVGTLGFYWSSSVYTPPDYSYSLYFYTTDVHPQGVSSKYYGNAVRCIAQNSVTVAFDANGGTGEMSAQKLYENDATLKSNTFTRDSYAFLGWSEDANATTATYADGASVSDLVSRGGNITLYAVWLKIDGDMQDWLGCGKISEGDIARLRDTRDNKIYTVKKLPDGKCWMIDNLTISATGMVVDSLDNTNTNIPSSDTNKYYLPPQNMRNATAYSITSSATKTANTAISFNGSYSNQPQVGYRAAGTTNNSTGNAVPENTAYYNFYTASLGFSYYQDGKTSGSSPRDICPKGWRLPWVGDSGSSNTGTGDMYTLALSYNDSSNVWSNYITPGSSSSTNPYTSNATVRQNMVAGDSGSLDRFASNGAASFTYAGVYLGSTLNYVGTTGYYWSSSVYNTNVSYNLVFDATNVYPQYYYSKDHGFAVRCVAKYNDVGVDIDGTMQDFDASTLTNVGDSAKLMDSRDGKVYTVKKLSDGKVWMIDNLTISATGMVVDALDNTNTNIPSSDTNKYYLPPQNGRSTSNSITSSATKIASSAVYFNGNYSNQPQVGYRTQGSTDNRNHKAIPEDTAYYNFYTVSLGYSYVNDSKTSGSTPRDICPKGWRLPWVSDSGTTANTGGDFVTLAKSYNSDASWTKSNTDYGYYTSDSIIHYNMVAGDANSIDRFASNGAAGFTYTGYYNSTTLEGVGAYGNYGSSSIFNSSSSYDFHFDFDNPTYYEYPQIYENKGTGLPVRCIAGAR